jgi:hypothetical protein
MRTHGAPGQGAQRQLTRQTAHTPTYVSEPLMHPKTMGFLQIVAKAFGTDRPQIIPSTLHVARSTHKRQNSDGHISLLCGCYSQLGDSGILA